MSEKGSDNSGETRISQLQPISLSFDFSYFATFSQVISKKLDWAWTVLIFWQSQF